MKGDVVRMRTGGPFYAWAFDPAAGKWARRSTRKKNKRDAERVAEQWTREGERMERGEAPDVDWAAMPVERHIDDYMAFKRTSEKVIGRKHLDDTRRQLLELAKAGEWRSVRQITMDSFLAAVARIQQSREAAAGERDRILEDRADARTEIAVIRAAGERAPQELVARSRQIAGQKRDASPLSRASLNHLRASAKALSRWLHTRGRLPMDPLAGLQRWTQTGYETFRRRSLEPEELQRLFEAAANGAELCGVAGPDREMLYRVALATGFRRFELGSLRVVDLVLRPPAPTRPHCRLSAAAAKNDKPHEQPLPAYIVPLLEKWVAGRDPQTRLWPEMGVDTAQMIATDLRAAGIPVVDETGRRLDFHALRHTFGTLLARASVTPQECQMLMRHSDMNLTMKLYTHLGAKVLASAADRLDFGSANRQVVGNERCSGAAVEVAAPDDACREERDSSDASNAAQPKTRADDKEGVTMPDENRREWAGWDSNPRHADYESSLADSESAARSGVAQRDADGAVAALQCAETGAAGAAAALDDGAAGPESEPGSDDDPDQRRRGAATHAPTSAPPVRAPSARAAHARERADAGLKPDLDLAFARVRDLAAMATGGHGAAGTGGGR